MHEGREVATPLDWLQAGDWTVHLSWPLVRPPAINWIYLPTGSAVTSMYTLLLAWGLIMTGGNPVMCGLFLGAAAVHVVMYRRSFRRAIAQRFRERILGRA
jgi:hypothetical protein